MTGVILSERIRYISCEDPEGNHGVLVLLGNDKYQTQTIEVNTQNDFRIGYENLRVAESVQAELEVPLQELVTA